MELWDIACAQRMFAERIRVYTVFSRAGPMSQESLALLYPSSASGIVSGTQPGPGELIDWVDEYMNES